MGALVDQDGKSEIMQAIARQDRSRFVEGAMHGRLAASHVVIVHGRQIVMHQRIDVNAFDGETDPDRAGLGDIE